MANFLSITLNVNKTTHIEDVTANAYSKIGKAQPGKTKTEQLPQNSNGFLTKEDLNKIKLDWKELSLDVTQLGLSIVGLIEVAEPFQIAADVTNGAIDFKRGHPLLGTLSMLSATPVAGLLSGLALFGLRIIKCLWNGFKFFGKVVWIIAKSGVCKMASFIFTKGQHLVSYLPKTEQITECVLKAGHNISKYTSDSILTFTEGVKNLLVKVQKSLSQVNTTEIKFQDNTNSFENVIINNMKSKSGKVDIDTYNANSGGAIRQWQTMKGYNMNPIPKPQL